MSIFRKLFQSGSRDKDEVLEAIQKKFQYFMTLLENNNKVLKISSDMEEKSHGEFLFDINYIRKSVSDIQASLNKIIESMIYLGGTPYKKLRIVYKEINELIEKSLNGKKEISQDFYVKFLADINKGDIDSVGSKNAQLGEVKSQLKIPVPRGFAITAWAYKDFLNSNNLQEKISNEIVNVDIRDYSDLERISNKLRALFAEMPLPQGLVRQIDESYRELKEYNRRTMDTTLPVGMEGLVSVRSSAIGEDTHLSFAGQYETFLNVNEGEVTSRYKDVLSSRFSPKAIYYFLSHELNEADLAMSVGCVTMVNARASGVIYTRDPVHPKAESMLINSIWGLGAYLVDGTITPDVFRVSLENGNILDQDISCKTKKLCINNDGAISDEIVPPHEQYAPSISKDEIQVLAGFARTIENHYGEPQDIEWAISKDGRPFVLQTRQLRLIEEEEEKEMPNTDEYDLIMSGGYTVFPGAGGGTIHHVRNTNDLKNIPDGVILVSEHPFPGLITALSKANALITKVGSIASHLATIAREYRTPTIFGVKSPELLLDGQYVTVDSAHLKIYNGVQEELIEALQPEKDFFKDDPIFDLLENILDNISPLNLINPNEEEFTMENCKTFHDMTRYCHQKSMQEMFAGVTEVSAGGNLGVLLKSDIPLDVDVMYIDRDMSEIMAKKYINFADLDSDPMQSFWGGILKEGWPAPPKPNMKGMLSVVATNLSAAHQEDFSQKSFAILSKEFMILSLKMGYHFTTFESMCTDDISKNYIKMQFKAGGAALERRVRRISLINEVLAKIGFDNSSKGDYLDAMVTYEPAESIKSKLYILGRLSMLTKQLDMALSNDKITKFYTNDILRKLGIS